MELTKNETTDINSNPGRWNARGNHRFSQAADPTPNQEQRISDLEAQLENLKLKTQLSDAKQPTATPSPSPAAPTFIINNNNNNTVAAVPTPQPTPETQEAPSTTVIDPQHQQYPALMEWVISVNEALDRHDTAWITRFTSGSINYFGHSKTSDGYIVRDISNDDRTYLVGHSTYYPDTFTHEVSDEYSRRWVGPMLYDSITTYTEVQQRYGRLHRAHIRFTVGYTYIEGRTTIYALAMKVL